MREATTLTAAAETTAAAAVTPMYHRWAAAAAGEGTNVRRRSPEGCVAPITLLVMVAFPPIRIWLSAPVKIKLADIQQR